MGPIDPVLLRAALLGIYAEYPGICQAAGVIVFVFLLYVAVIEAAAWVKRSTN